MKLLLISRDTDAADALVKAANDLNVETKVVDPDDLYLVDVEGAPQLFVEGQQLEIPEAVLIRDGTFNMFIKRVLDELCTSKGAKVVNSFEAIDSCRHKYLTQILLSALDVKTPQTGFISKASQLPHILEVLGDEYPKIIKTVTGSHGIGVIKVDSESSLRSVVQVLLKDYDELIIQAFLPHTEDYRILTIGGKSVAFMKRGIPDDDFRSNLEHQTDREKALDEYVPSQAERDVAEKVAKELDIAISAIDYALVDGEVVVFEVNTSPGLNGIQSITKDVDIASEMIKYVMGIEAPVTVENSDEESQEPSIHTDKDGVLLTKIQFSRVASDVIFDAKVDTGAEKSWIDASDVEVGEDMVAFTIGEVRYKLPVLRVSTIKFAGGTLVHRDVPIVELDIKGPSGEVTVEFIVWPRKHQYKVLLGRNALTALGMSFEFTQEQDPKEDE